MIAVPTPISRLIAKRATGFVPCHDPIYSLSRPGSCAVRPVPDARRPRTRPAPLILPLRHHLRRRLAFEDLERAVPAPALEHRQVNVQHRQGLELAGKPQAAAVDRIESQLLRQLAND